MRLCNSGNISINDLTNYTPKEGTKFIINDLEELCEFPINKFALEKRKILKKGDIVKYIGYPPNCYGDIWWVQIYEQVIPVAYWELR